MTSLLLSLLAILFLSSLIVVYSYIACKERTWPDSQIVFSGFLYDNVCKPKALRRGVRHGALISSGLILLGVIVSLISSDWRPLLMSLLIAITASAFVVIYEWAIAAPADAHFKTRMIEGIGRGYDVEIDWWHLDEHRFARGSARDWRDYICSMEGSKR